ncbi:hypothetical protein FXN63_19890 [Pigmentiphaga aceris]|uniref:Uncharacterized protein n=1 Tax=Pigmentiphaga aceris TaxID=1940612 RepID=A0A5C0B5P0_9BURK|nr:hypothetical protein [Pigmentiphaga aceris]QEI07847.1 hypothetical protein FXN63_19890 [Pigmentiphaga aceris]
MSQHDWFIFPTHPHLPPPDWPALSQRLIDTGILLPADGQHIAPEDLRELSSELAIHGQTSWVDIDPSWRTTADVVDAYRASSEAIARLSLAPGLSMADTVATMREQGFAFQFWPSSDAERCAWGGTRHRLGDAAAALFDDKDEWVREANALSFSLLAYAGSPNVTAGENLCAPLRPGTDEPLELMAPFGTHVDFIGAAYEDPAVTWTDPDTGKSFHIFDLDWSQSLGLGYRFLKIEGGWHADFFERLRAHLAGLLGQPMTISHQHL